MFGGKLAVICACDHQAVPSLVLWCGHLHAAVNKKAPRQGIGEVLCLDFFPIREGKTYQSTWRRLVRFLPSFLINAVRSNISKIIWSFIHLSIRQKFWFSHHDSFDSVKTAGCCVYNVMGEQIQSTGETIFSRFLDLHVIDSKI